MQGAYVARMAKPLVGILHDHVALPDGNVLLAEGYRNNGSDRPDEARVYIRPNACDTHVTTYVIGTEGVLSALARREPLSPQPYIGEIRDGEGQVVFTHKDLIQHGVVAPVLEREGLLVAERKTTHVRNGPPIYVDRRGRQVASGSRRAVAKLQIFQDFRGSDHSTLITAPNEREHLTRTAPALNLTTSPDVMRHRERMRWFQVR